MIKTIPTLLTLANLVCGFVAIQMGDFYISALLILVSFVFDGFDGYAARKLSAESNMGKQLDSLADMVSFGVAPAYLYYLMAPNDSMITYAAPVLIVMAGALRLAKFNVSPSKGHFMGLPIPANALFYLGLILSIQTGNEFISDLYNNQWVYIATPVVLSGLMVSFHIKMFSTKTMSDKFFENKFQLATFLIFLILTYLFKFAALSYIILVYVLLSLFYSVTFKDNDEVIA
ncbi:MAG: CDP-diacylglycerol--serine O-phosphatidyltransferase [Saprospiraceae bacterium]|nr:CDP-diacylglycerol--serine O-phosphatidyltransferase [Saprospiraceae bacterium]